jgi:hypothetical protein
VITREISWGTGSDSEIQKEKKREINSGSTKLTGIQMERMTGKDSVINFSTMKGIMMGTVRETTTGLEKPTKKGSMSVMLMSLLMD